MEGRRKRKAKKWQTKREKAMAAVGAERREAAQKASENGGDRRASARSTALNAPIPKVQDFNGDVSDNSVDEEEEYYEGYYGKDGDRNDSEEEGEDDDEDSDDEDSDDEEEDEEDDESRYTLLLRDLVRPLDAWNMSLAGKLGLGAVPPVPDPDQDEVDGAAETSNLDEDEYLEEEEDEEDDDVVDDEDVEMKDVESGGEDASSPPVSPQGKQPASKKKAGGGGGGAMSPADWMVAMQQRIGKVRHELKDRAHELKDRAHELKDRRKSEPITFQGLRRPDRCICVYMCVCVCVCVCDRGACECALYYI